MRDKKLIKRVMAAVCAAMCVVFTQLLPLVSGIGVGLILQLPVLLCSIVCGSGAGALCAFAGIVLAAVVMGMPGMVLLPVLLCECVMYGVLAGAIFRMHDGKNTDHRLIICILFSGLAGRLSGGVLFSLLYAQGVGAMLSCCFLYTAVGVPAVVIWLVLLPAVLKYLGDAGMPLFPQKLSTRSDSKQEK